MIVEFIINGFLIVVNGMLSLLPQIPAMPTAITNGATWITDTIGNGIDILSYIYGSGLLSALIIIFVAIMAFDFYYGTLLWIVKKIPFTNIS